MTSRAPSIALAALCAAAPLDAQHLPTLLPLRAGDRLDTLERADRAQQERADALASESPDGGAGLVDVLLVNGVDFSSNSGLNEPIQYQLPSSYDPLSAPIPLVVAYHGFGMSDGSTSLLSSIDEECEARGWAYLAPTGADDKVFGSVTGQEHLLGAIEWMLAGFQLDAERIYMVGFSMGGGISANFAARQRDPDGVMIAALGMVSSTLDWTMEYCLGTSALQSLLVHPLNFGDTPLAAPFEYQRSSTLVQTGYPPVPGTTLVPLSMATNLGATPVYLTYDSQDTISYVPALNRHLFSLLVAQGGQAQVHPITGTFPPHSWDVLDEQALFDFFDGRVVERYPAQFQAQLDRDAGVSWASITQASAGGFSYVDGLADPIADELVLDLLENVSAAEVSAQLAGVAEGSPPRLTLNASAGVAPSVRLHDFRSPPSYLLAALGGVLVTGVDSDPLGAALIAPLSDGASLDVHVIHAPSWTSVLTTSPDPVPNGQLLQVDHDGPSGSALGLLLIASSEALAAIQGIPLTAALAQPLVLKPMAVDASGDASLLLPVPADPSLAGLRLPLQSAAVDFGGQLTSASNLWGLHID